MNNQDRKNGFTLLELLISVAVFAVLSLMAYGGLNNVIMSSELAQKALERTKNIQQAVFILSRDLNQITPRSVRDELDTRQPALSAGGLETFIEFTRNGRRNPAERRRSNLLRVAYRFDDNKLIRYYWPQLDRMEGVAPYERMLLSEVESIELRFLDQNNEWQTQWPASAPTTAASASVSELPLAIEFKIKLFDWGEITRIIRVSF